MPPADRCRDAPQRCFRPADFAADVLAFMDVKRIPRAHFVGHSLGSLVGQEIALESPGRVRRLVLIASAAKTRDNPVVRDFLVAGLAEGAWKEALTRQGLAFPGAAYERTPLDADPNAENWLAANWVVATAADPAVLAAIVPETARVKIGTWLGAARALLEVDNTERLKSLGAPTLVVWATQDNIFPSPDQDALRASLDAAAAQCRASWFWKPYGRKPLPSSGNQEDDIGHNTQWDAPEAAARDIAAFLREGGRPTEDLPYQDPAGARRVLTAPGEAGLLAGPARNCPPAAAR
jgi:pimeloyl-ACP methyl ester carboxylesterase